VQTPLGSERRRVSMRAGTTGPSRAELGRVCEKEEKGKRAGWPPTAQDREPGERKKKKGLGLTLKLG
jgi:hypothetical protein